jgi:hypothetical protein
MRALLFFFVLFAGLLRAETTGDDRPVVISAHASNYKDVEKNWIMKRYPGANITSESALSVDSNGAGHTSVSFTTAHGETKSVRFYVGFVK